MSSTSTASANDVEAKGINQEQHAPSRSPGRPPRKKDPIRVSARESIVQLRGEGVISVGASLDLMIKLSRRYRPRRSHHAEHKKQQIQPTVELTYITSLVQDIAWVFSELEYQVDMAQIERWALFLHEVLTQEYRKFHDVVHVYEISAGASPLQFLSAAFRDVIRYYFNGETGPKEAALVDGVCIVNPENKTVVLSPDLTDERELLVADIFDFSPGDVTENINGQHKKLDLFLSAVCGARLLKDHLNLTHTAQMAACLEASIPFRKAATPNEKSPCERLFDRLSKCNDKYNLQMSEDELIETIEQAVDLRNRTVGNMVTDDIADFLDHTWNLLPERNQSLRKCSLHTLSEYYEAVCGTTKVMEKIRPDSVYGHFRGYPVERDRILFHDIITKNLRKAVLYIRARLLSVATVTAFACLTGGDAPKSFFFGDLPSVHRESHRLGDSLLHEIPAALSESSEYSAETYDLLRGNRMSETGFDTRNAPLAAYMYQTIRNDSLLEEYANTYYECPMRAENARALLRALPFDLVLIVGAEVGRIAISRRKAIGKILKDLENTGV